MPKKKNNPANPDQREALSLLRSWHDGPLMVDAGWHRKMSALYEQATAGDALTIDAIRAQLGISDDDQRKARIEGRTGVMYLHGPIVPRPSYITRHLGGTAISQFMRELKAFDANENVERIWIDGNTPGGSCRMLWEAAELIRDIRTRKPVEGFVSECCASAGYFLLSACTHITATPSSQVGSIGTIIEHSSMQGFWESMGVIDTLVFKGRFKADAHPDQDLTEQGRESLDKIVTAFYDQFWRALELNLGTTRAASEPQFGEGRVMIAAEALAAGMIHQVADQETRWAEFTGAANNSTAPQSSDHSLLTTHSSPPAASAVGSPTAASAAQEKMTMKNRIIAALVTLGVLTEFAPSEQEYQAALRGVFTGDVPESEEKILSALTTRIANQASGAAGSAGTAPTGSGPAGSAAADDVTASGTGSGNDRLAGITAERTRQHEIRVRGQALDVAADVIDAAITAGTSLPKFLEQVTESKAGEERPLTRRVEVTRNEGDVVSSAAVEAMFYRLDALGPIPVGSIGGTRAQARLLPDGHRLSAAAAGMVRMDNVTLASRVLDALGIDRTAMDNEEIAGTFLSLGTRRSEEKMRLDRCDVLGAGASSTITVNRVGDYPDITGAMMDMMFRRSFEVIALTYPRFAYRSDSLANLDPQSLVEIGGPRVMDEIEDTQDLPERKLATEKEWIVAKEYGESFGLSSRMFLQNKVRIWERAVMTLQADYWLTLQNTLINLLLGNPKTSDGSNAFTVGDPHNNVLAGGGAPDKTQAKTLKKLLRRQTAVGSEELTRAEPAFAITGTEWEDEAILTFRRLQNVVYTDDQDVNLYATGSIDPIMEPMLDRGANDGKTWFMGVDINQQPGLAYAELMGREGGRRQTWYEPRNRTRWASVDGSFGAALINFRSFARNPGQ